MRYPRAPARGESAFPPSSHHARFSAQRHRKLIRPRQFLQMTQRELFEEKWRGAIEQWPAEAVATRGHGDQSALHQRAQHSADVYATNLFDFRATDRLAIRNNRERLEGRP